MKITVIGGGNIGTLMAAEFAYKGNDVTIFTSDPSKWNNDILVNDEKGEKLFLAHINEITNDLEKALLGAEYIFVALPSFLYPSLATRMLPFVKAGQKLGFVPGSGGAEFIFSKILDKGVILFGIQRVHSISRLEKYGHIVDMLGRKSELQVASIPKKFSKDIALDLENLFDIPCVTLPNYLTVTLTPSNPILHTTRLYSMFKDNEEYDHNILFYEEWTDDSSKVLFECDRELQNIIKLIPELDLSGVISLPIYYESETFSDLTKKIKSIKAFHGITSPMKEKSGKWVPDFESRYFVEDYPYGLEIIKQMAYLCGCDTPNIDEVLRWSREKISGVKWFNFTDYNITSIDQIVELNK